MDQLNVLGLVLNINKEKAYETAAQVLSWFKDKEIDILIEKEAALEMNRENLQASYEKLRKKADMIIIFGGDGTFLYTAHHFIGSEIPMLGINLGKLGFLTEIETEELNNTLEKIYKGEYTLEERMMLEASVKRENRIINKNYALNDIVVNRGGNAKMISIKLFINDEFVNSYRADGLIIATPTGSTAYNLSAGGPIINPQIKAIIITPICPHTLYVRPMVISKEENVKIDIAGENGGMKITADGKIINSLENKDKILLKASPHNIKMVKFSDKTFYTILHEKMRVGLV